MLYMSLQTNVVLIHVPLLALSMQTPNLFITDLIVDAPFWVQEKTLKMVAKRYSATAVPREEGITILMVHGVGAGEQPFPLYALLLH